RFEALVAVQRELFWDDGYRSYAESAPRQAGRHSRSPVLAVRCHWLAPIGWIRCVPLPTQGFGEVLRSPSPPARTEETLPCRSGARRDGSRRGIRSVARNLRCRRG